MEKDRQIVQKVLGGNAEAFAEIVKNHQRSIYFLVLRMVKNSETADDITQKTFLKAYRALAGFQFRSSLKTWLSSIAINLCRTELKKPRRESADMPEFLPDPSLEQRNEKEELDHRRTLLKEGLDQLPQRQKEVVMLRIYQEMPFKDIAEALESSESAVKVNFHHAMKGLREWVQERKQK